MQEEASTIIGVCVWGNDGPIFPELPVQCRLNLVEAREVIGYIIGILGSIHFKKDSVVNSFHGRSGSSSNLRFIAATRHKASLFASSGAWPCSPGILTICVMSMSV
ncbi:hypothetical protein ACOMHN_008708 [Nucella lapillus]